MGLSELLAIVEIRFPLTDIKKDARGKAGNVTQGRLTNEASALGGLVPPALELAPCACKVMTSRAQLERDQEPPSRTGGVSTKFDRTWAASIRHLISLRGTLSKGLRRCSDRRKPEQPSKNPTTLHLEKPHHSAPELRLLIKRPR